MLKYYVKLSLICFVIIWVYKLSFNTYLYMRTRALYSRYTNFEHSNNPNDCSIVSDLAEIKELFARVGIKPDLQVPFNSNTATGKIQPLMNINNTMPEVTMFYNLRFNEALGYFKKNIIDTFNPFYWIEFFIYIPQKLLEYVNVVNNIFVKLANIVYWLTLSYLIIRNIIR